jgi:hypothetical protein
MMEKSLPNGRVAYFAKANRFSAFADDDAKAQKSPLVLYEDDKPLGPGHSDHYDVEKMGLGHILIGRISTSCSRHPTTAIRTKTAALTGRLLSQTDRRRRPEMFAVYLGSRKCRRKVCQTEGWRRRSSPVDREAWLARSAQPKACSFWGLRFRVRDRNWGHAWTTISIPHRRGTFLSHLSLRF